ncbi:T9SS type A sorting domain-containing protein [Flavobacteriaceae bacterium S356]|uniref:T9SS type A sorting domain-containing protein n=1 Tax=Asprobacillus argus TaxID=3076534 RepID=A0ABU3LHX9_9FLAO|nr:T9SS type A sorting domain-containing protein [Flavobacteriaceae bacterium S356]
MRRLHKIGAVAFLFIFVLHTHGQTRIKTMFYNLLNYSNSVVSQNKTVHLKTVLDDIQPDLFMVCELINVQGSDYLYNNAVLASNPDFAKATFEISQSAASGLQQMVYYNSKKLILESSNIITTNVRDINQYTFKINTVDADTNPIKIEVFVTHLKASTGNTNRQLRLSSVDEFVGELFSMPTDSYVLFAGDFNLYTSNEEAYVRLTDNSNPIVMIDPIDRPAQPFPNDGTDYFDPDHYNINYFWRSNAFADIHTQSTRTSNTGLIDDSGATGGLDDRFDFIMMSENFNTSSNLFYVNNSYKAYGNNGNCYNSYISNTNCNGTYSQAIRNALIEFSDHLPVIMEIETPSNTLSLASVENPISFIGSNVVDDFLEINVEPSFSVHRVSIYNQMGQLLQRESLQDLSIIRLDVSHLSKGVYYIRAGNQLKPIKFLKI